MCIYSPTPSPVLLFVRLCLILPHDEYQYTTQNGAAGGTQNRGAAPDSLLDDYCTFLCNNVYVLVLYILLCWILLGPVCLKIRAILRI